MSDVDVRHFTWRRADESGPYHTVKIRTEYHEVEVTVSPTGRSIHVWLNGEQLVLPLKDV